jgi:hypothetical protein
MMTEELLRGTIVKRDHRNYLPYGTIEVKQYLKKILKVEKRTNQYQYLNIISLFYRGLSSFNQI